MPSDNNNSQYPFPNEGGVNQVHRHHFILRDACQSNVAASLLKNLISDAKIGCNVGSWILELASEYPSSQFTGVSNCPPGF
ncbi:10789_t:CDS:2 [Funneliformis caledonium]|uniref:10789_t:CDS:1 n=1 Tax=Funneliformis caledonium TaxID=1117310 RepID=A0A9N9BFG0_9GLOM|nr:10789_t:CDS:2 [Funneliformis caledonium]